MKKSSSRDRNVQSNQPQLSKTVQEQKPSTPIINSRPESGKKLESSKNLPPKLPSKQKVQYNVDAHMTQSKICEAKSGLTLLKKKLSQRGISHEKVSTKTIQQPQIKQSMSKNSNKPNLPSSNKIPSNAYNENIQEVSPKVAQKKPTKPVQKPTKNYQPQPQQQYYNQRQQVQIAPKKDFYALLEEQLRKQNQNKSNMKNKPQNNQPKGFITTPSQYPDDDTQVYECSKGCGRKFNAEVLPKHEKVCEKVFQSKRKVFNTAEQRQVQAQGGIKMAPSIAPSKKPKKQVAVQKPVSKVPKWKIQSAQFRAGLKATRNVQLTAQQKQLTQQAKQAMLQCQYCGRKFSQAAGTRHIAFCQKKSKQLPKMNTTMKKKK